MVRSWFKRALPDIYDGIFDYAKTYIKSNSQYNPKVVKDTPQQEKFFPIIIIKQTKDSLIDENLDKTDQKFKMVYEIEIYTIDTEDKAKQEITKELVKLVNDVFDEHFGFMRRTNKNIPNIDLNVDRQYLRYDGKLDFNNIIYRR